MVDFKKLRADKKKSEPTDPIDIFRRLPKPPGINDLYTSQAEVLSAWFSRRTDRDVVVKLHTGGGKTLVGLLMAQSTLNESKEPVLYLTPTVQLVNQALEKARALGIRAVSYERGQPLHDDFVNAKALMIATYKALFNGRSKFGLRGSAQPQKVGAIVLDDAHAAFSELRESFTLEVSSVNERARYLSLCNLFRSAFNEINRIGTFDGVIGNGDDGVLEVPYWSWHEQLDAVREQLKSDTDNYGFVWPLLRDRLHLCHALISRESFSITSILPFVNSFPTFFEAPRRIYMSATIADDSDLIRTFDVDPASVQDPLVSRSLAGVSERMLLIPELMPFELDVQGAVKRIIQQVAQKRLGAVVLVPSNNAAQQWKDAAEVAIGSDAVEKLVSELQSGQNFGPIVFANRYDGIDLPADSCRVLVLSGLPAGTSSYELFRAGTLYSGKTITKMLAQRIEQGMGRGARGAGDHCVVILVGSDLSGWVAKEANFNFLTSATRAQLEMGFEVSKQVADVDGLVGTITLSIDRDEEWVKYHAETLAELTELKVAEESAFDEAIRERKAINFWEDGYHEKAISTVTKSQHLAQLDQHTRGWMEQLAARIADHWGNETLADQYQHQAYANNRNLCRPKARPTYRQLSNPGEQATAIVKQLKDYKLRRGFLQSFERTVSLLHRHSTPKQFEQALADFGSIIGFVSERHDERGEGPDVLWLLPESTGLVIEVKSKKKTDNALTKDDHGQLLVAAEWFRRNYENYRCVRVSVHPNNRATKPADAGGSYALTFEKLAEMVSEARKLLEALCNSHLNVEDLVVECERLIGKSPISHQHLVSHYLMPFETDT